jgi:hypothetical protein
MRRELHRLAPALGLIVAACRSQAPSPIREMRLGGPLLGHEVTLPQPISSEGDGFGFAAASAVDFDGDRLVVVEAGNHRLVRFDTTWHPELRIGREGAGPGELRGPAALAIWRDRYAVSEVGNSRVSVFGADGTFLRSFAIPHGYSDVGFGADGTIYVDAYDGRNFLLSADTAGTLRPFGERPWDLYPGDVLIAPARQVDGHVLLAVTDSGTVHVYDPVIAALVSFDRRGTRLGLCGLPRTIGGRLVESAELAMRDFGGRGRSARANITGLSAADRGQVLLLFPNVGAIGLLAEPRSCRGREIRWGPGLDPRFGGFRGLVRGDLLYRLTGDDLRLFRLIPE